jgi:hypothetical protein
VHAQDLQGQVQGEAQLRVLAEGTEHALELRDPVAQRVVVEVQVPRRPAPR